MKRYLLTLLFFFTFFTTSATFSAPKIVVPTSSSFFQKTEQVSHSEKAKIGFGNFARSSLEEQQAQTSTFHQNTFLLSSYLKEENSYSLDFQKTASQNQVLDAQFSKKEALSLMENRARVRSVQGVSTAGSWMDDIYNAQKNIINQWKNTIENASNIRKGNFGEMASDAFLTEKSFQPLHTRLDNIDAPTRQGIDGVFKKGNEYFIVEAKYHGTATLSTLTDGTKQMSDAWITGGGANNRLFQAVGGNQAIYDDIINSGYKRLLAEIAPDGTVIYKELDASASVIGSFTP